MAGQDSVFGRRPRALIALATVFVMLFSIADVFFCGLETTPSGMAITLHSDQEGLLHAHSGHADEHHVIPADRDGHHESGENGHQDCVHGHFYHGISMMAGVAEIERPEISRSGVAYNSTAFASIVPYGIERPPRV